MTGCELHRYHWPKPLRIVVHHIQPLAMAGLDIPANRINTCDAGHYDVHRVLDALLHGQPLPTSTRKERRCAQRGYDAWVSAGKPGKPVYQLHEHLGEPADHGVKAVIAVHTKKRNR